MCARSLWFAIAYLFSANVYASATELYNKLTLNTATIHNIGLAGKYTYVVLKGLKYEFHPMYGEVKLPNNCLAYSVVKALPNTNRQDGVGDSPRSGYYLLYLDNQKKQKTGCENARFAIGNQVALSVAKENAFNDNGNGEVSIGLAGQKAYFSTKTYDIKHKLVARPLLNSYQYLISHDAKKAYRISDMLRNQYRDDKNGTVIEEQAVTYFVDSTDIAGASTTGGFALAGSYYTHNPLQETLFFENTAKITAFGIAGNNTYITLQHPKYEFDSTYDVIYPDIMSTPIDILSTQLNTKRSEVTVNGRRETRLESSLDSIVVYLPGTQGYNFHVGQHIYLSEQYENSAKVVHRSLRNQYTYVEISNLKRPFKAGYNLLRPIRSGTSAGQSLAIHAINNLGGGKYGIYIVGRYADRFALDSTVRLAPAFNQSLSANNNGVYINGKLIDSRNGVVELSGNYRVVKDTLSGSKNIIMPIDHVVKFSESARVEVPAGFSLTIKGTLEAGMHRIFYGSGKIKGQPKASVYGYDDIASTSQTPFNVIPQWWGAVGDAMTNNSAAFHRFSNSIQDHWTIYIPAGEYLLNSGGFSIEGKSHVEIFGAGNHERKADTDESYTASEQLYLPNVRWSSKPVTRLRPAKQRITNEFGIEGIGNPAPYPNRGPEQIEAVPYFTTLTIDSGHAISLRDMVIETRGKFWGDTDHPQLSFDAYGRLKAQWAKNAGGSALLVSRSTDVTLSNLDARLAGSVASVYLSSNNRVTLNYVFANAGSYGYASFNPDNWVDANINKNGKYTFNYCSSAAENGLGTISGKGGIVIEGDNQNVPKVTVTGGLYRDAQPGSDFLDGGNGISSDTANLTVTNVDLVNNMTALRLTAKSITEKLTTNISNSRLLNNRAAGIYAKFIEAQQQGEDPSHSIMLSNLEIKTNNSSVWSQFPSAQPLLLDKSTNFIIHALYPISINLKNNKVSGGEYGMSISTREHTIQPTFSCENDSPTNWGKLRLPMKGC
ncbi:hypothetical protein CWB99_21830 [Pseudoalteromonas rubra]|uniref:Pectate lyase superfamily protein domain-containing protein n=1 Tax=Pseudoalteromonas rubra TaxID=43658 RepID=A0A5S3WG45_9GAMM|nr:hypothetical protein [Pseudoalteromonas rubra]TMP24652.1 hypothetical protein CWB99_21830 [Pseudoalteromonas rubra]TMP36275.1 hypothetical protein CWC00_02195 [Pseudoalteromonas rubra]